MSHIRSIAGLGRHGKRETESQRNSRPGGPAPSDRTLSKKAQKLFGKTGPKRLPCGAATKTPVGYGKAPPRARYSI